MKNNFPSLNVIFWSGKTIGNENKRLSRIIDEMLQYCYNIDFSQILQSNKPDPDLIILGEIFPVDYEDSRFYPLLNRIGNITTVYKGSIVPLVSNSNNRANTEHFLVAFNTRTVANVKTQLIEYRDQSNKRSPLLITVNMAQAPNKDCRDHLFHEESLCPSKQRNWPYRIAAFHFEGSSASSEIAKLGGYCETNTSPLRSPHLLVGDTNLYKSKYHTVSQKSEDGNAIVFPRPIQELTFQKIKGTTLLENGEESNNIIDRAWFNSNLLSAKGHYLRFGPDGKIYNINGKIKSKLSDHLALAITLNTSSE